MEVDSVNSINKLYDYYKDILPGKLVVADDDNLIWVIDDDTSLFISSDKCKINLVAYKKTLVKLAKNDVEYYKEDMIRFYKDVHNIINKLKKGETKELFYSRKYCLSLNKKRNKRFIIISILVIAIILSVCYSILFN